MREQRRSRVGRPAATIAALAAWTSLAAALSGCPLPQPVPAFEGDVTVTPPRILTETMQPAAGVVTVGTTCAAEDFIVFGGALDDPNLDDAVEARWFVDYANGAGLQDFDFPAPASDGADTRRALSGFRFFPARFSASPHVVEVVVSNGFYPLGEDPPGTPEPNRTARAGYETQVFRWVVVYEPSGRCS